VGVVENAKKCRLYSTFPYILRCAKSREILGILNSSLGNF